MLQPLLVAWGEQVVAQVKHSPGVSISVQEKLRLLQTYADKLSELYGAGRRLRWEKVDGEAVLLGPDIPWKTWDDLGPSGNAPDDAVLKGFVVALLQQHVGCLWGIVEECNASVARLTTAS